MSQIKLFVLKLLLNYNIDASARPNSVEIVDIKKPFNIIETKEVLFSSPANSVNVTIDRVAY